MCALSFGSMSFRFRSSTAVSARGYVQVRRQSGAHIAVWSVDMNPDALLLDREAPALEERPGDDAHVRKERSRAGVKRSRMNVIVDDEQGVVLPPTRASTVICCTSHTFLRTVASVGLVPRERTAS